MVGRQDTAFDYLNIWLVFIIECESLKVRKIGKWGGKQNQKEKGYDSEVNFHLSTEIKKP